MGCLHSACGGASRGRRGRRFEQAIQPAGQFGLRLGASWNWPAHDQVCVETPGRAIHHDSHLHLRIFPAKVFHKPVPACSPGRDHEKVNRDLKPAHEFLRLGRSPGRERLMPGGAEGACHPELEAQISVYNENCAQQERSGAPLCNRQASLQAASARWLRSIPHSGPAGNPSRDFLCVTAPGGPGREARNALPRLRMVRLMLVRKPKAMAATGRQKSEEETGDRRANRRYPLEADLEYRLLRDQKVVEMGRGRTLNLSSAGVLFEASGPISPGTRVELSIAWPAPGDLGDRIRLHITGRAVRCQDRIVAARIVGYEFRVREESGHGAG